MEFFFYQISTHHLWFDNSLHFRVVVNCWEFNRIHITKGHCRILQGAKLEGDSCLDWPRIVRGWIADTAVGQTPWMWAKNSKHHRTWTGLCLEDTVFGIPWRELFSAKSRRMDVNFLSVFMLTVFTHLKSSLESIFSNLILSKKHIYQILTIFTDLKALIYKH